MVPHPHLPEPYRAETGERQGQRIPGINSMLHKEKYDGENKKEKGQRAVGTMVLCIQYQKHVESPAKEPKQNSVT